MSSMKSSRQRKRRAKEALRYMKGIGLYVLERPAQGKLRSCAWLYTALWRNTWRVLRLSMTQRTFGLSILAIFKLLMLPLFCVLVFLTAIFLPSRFEEILDGMWRSQQKRSPHFPYNLLGVDASSMASGIRRPTSALLKNLRKQLARAGRG